MAMKGAPQIPESPKSPKSCDSDDFDEPGTLGLHVGVLRWVYGLAQSERPAPDSPASGR